MSNPKPYVRKMRVKCSRISPARMLYEAKAPKTPLRIKIMYNKLRKLKIA